MTITFTGAIIRYVDLRFEPKASATYVKIYMTANWTTKLRKALNAEDLPETFGAGTPEVTLNANNMELRCVEEGLKRQVVRFRIASISDFEIVRAEKERAKVVEVRFMVKTLADDAEAILGLYLRKCGHAKGEMDVDYEKQSELPLETAAAAAATK